MYFLVYAYNQCFWANSIVQFILGRIFYTVLNSLVSKNFYWQYVFLPPDETPSAIRDDPKFYPSFKDVCAAADGSQYGAYMPSADDALHHRHWHGDLTQNVLSACTFDLRFCYVLSGWEGSAAMAKFGKMLDGRIYSGAQKYCRWRCTCNNIAVIRNRQILFLM